MRKNSVCYESGKYLVPFKRKQRLTTAKFIGGVAAIVAKVAELSAVDALLVGASVLVYGIARTNSRRAHRHIVLVRSVAAVVDTVAQLILGDALVICALEPPRCVAFKVCW